MKIFNTIYTEWKYCNPHEWARYEDKWLPDSSIHLIKIYGRHDIAHTAWHPEFIGKLAFMNEIYANITNYKEFKYNEEREAMKYVDEFLLRVAKLKAFW